VTDELSDILNEAIPRWAKLTGTKLGTKSYSFRIGSDSKFQDHDLKRYIDDLNKARETDLSGMTAILFLRGLFEEYVKELSFQAHALLYAPTKVATTIGKLRDFHELIDREPCRDAVETFRDKVRAAALHYGYDARRLKKYLEDEWMLGELRLSASRSLTRLHTHQFAQGEPDPNPLQYNRQIFEFTNINSFLAALQRQWISGITLALIRGNDVYQAYFVLGLRNGQTLTILTDFEEGAHPEYHSMTRRPDRRLDERARLHRFPYRLLDADPVKHKQQKDKTAIVPLNAKAVPVEEIANLEPDEFVWLMLLFDLVAEKFGRDDFKAAELSYTGEMVVSPHTLIEGNHALVRSGQYSPLVLPKLTVETTTVERADTEKPNGFNAWMEDRYRHHVPELILDVVGERKALDVGKQMTKLLPGKADPDDLPALRRQPNVIGWYRDDRIQTIHPHALDPTYIGTKADIERNRAWAARTNMAQVIQRFAVAEFIAKQAMILSWYRKRLERNLPFLLKAIALGELVAPKTKWKSQIDHGFPDEDKLVWTTGNILEQEIAPTWWKAFPGDSFSTRGIAFGEWVHPHVECALDPPTRASVFTVITPDNPRALALLMGIPENRLPWPLQNWTTREPYTGNSILRRIDPQDCVLDNPWRHLELRVTFALCKREFNRIRKEHGLGASS
jgi:hypothetical protein